MLERLLAEIRLGGTIEMGTLAARLGASPELVGAMLEHLERLGWLQKVQNCTAPKCGGCSLADACIPKTQPGRLWKIGNSF